MYIYGMSAHAYHSSYSDTHAHSSTIPVWVTAQRLNYFGLVRLASIHLPESIMEEQKTKSVLVTYLERNKILKMPVSNKTADLKFLEEEFRKEFKFDSNVNLLITFQRFDGEWDEYVDLDEDGALVHKDKLKAVVSPMLTTPPNEISEVCKLAVNV